MSEKNLEAQIIEELDRVLRDQIMADEEARETERVYRAKQALVATREEEAQKLRRALYAMQGHNKDKGCANADNRTRISQIKRGNING